VTDSGGVLSTLPLPMSIAACVFGVLALSPGTAARPRPRCFYRGAGAAAMLLSMVFAGETWTFEKRKALLAAQFLLPTMGLVLGQLVRDEDRCDSPRFHVGADPAGAGATGRGVVAEAP
jgi:hypothetical protein